MQVTPLQLFWTALKLGFIAFGGPVAHLAWYRTVYVERKNWITESEYLRVVSLAQMLPGPTSSQAGFGIGYKLAGLGGGLAAWLGFTLPGFALITLFAAGLSPVISDPQIIQALKLVVAVIVAHAIWSMSGALEGKRQNFVWALATALIVNATDGRIGILLVIFSGVWFARKHLRDLRNIQLRLDALFALLLILGLLTVSTLASGQWQFFAVMLQAGLLVIGGGHVVLPILESGIVDNHLMPVSEFLAGYGVMNLLPGPLFNFAAYLGYLNPTTINGLLGAVLATVLIFLPGVVLMFWLFPKWDRLANSNLKHFVSGANVAVIGLLAASWWNPVLASVEISWQKIIVGLVGFFLIRKIPLTLAIFMTLAGALLVS